MRPEPQRVRCRTEECSNTILPATAKANDGYCMPCVNKRRREERDEYIRQNRREVDQYAGITDVVEIIRVMRTPRQHDPLVIFRPPPKSAEELYASLNADQANRLMTIAADAIRGGDEDFAEDVAKSVATLTDYSLDLMLEAWIARNHFWPSVVFRGAGAKIRDAVVDALEAGIANANQALAALAWIGDDKVQELFRRWETSLPTWHNDLFVGPAHYANVAGWELGTHERRNLFHDECWAITPAPTAQASDKSLQLMQEVNQSCPWCQRRLIHLVELDLADKRFAFLGVSGKKLSILSCDVCTRYGGGFMFSRMSGDGTARLADENKRPDWFPDNLSSFERSPWMDQPVRMHQRRAIHAVDWCMPVTISQIGGLPSWVQDSAFPKCPDCSGTMKFVTQVDNGQFPYHEGVYYAFLCASCGVTATTYQQT